LKVGIRQQKLDSWNLKNRKLKIRTCQQKLEKLLQFQNKEINKHEKIMIKKLTFLMILMIFSNCDKNKFLKVELNTSQLIPKGEWISNSDSLSGISIRENKIAFFKNMQFNSEDIYKYKIIDSVEYQNETKRILSTYLVTYDNADTIRYKIDARKNSMITLRLRDNKIETFRLKIKNRKVE
jgi:hypothetical protein